MADKNKVFGLKEARSFIPGQFYIYEIFVDGNVYVGQSSASDKNRLINHFRAAYGVVGNKAETDNNGSQLYELIRQHKLCDDEIEIMVWGQDDDYGIQNFSSVLQWFKKYWIPVDSAARRGKGRKGATTNETPTDFEFNDYQKLDVAEIFHIFYFAKAGYNLLNTQMGGQTTGFKYVIEDEGTSTKRIITRNMRPAEAMKMMEEVNPEVNKLINIEETIINQVFDPNWSEAKCKAFFEKSGAEMPQTSKANPYTFMTWRDFVEAEVRPFVSNLLGSRIVNNLKKLKTKSERTAYMKKTKLLTRTVKAKGLKNLRDDNIVEVVKKWVASKEEIIKAMVKVNNANENITLSISSFNWNGASIASYLSSAILNMSFKNFAYVDNIEAIQNNVKLAKLSLVWKFTREEERAIMQMAWYTAGDLKGNCPFNSDAFKRNISLLVFSKLCDQARKQKARMLISPTVAEVEGRIYKNYLLSFNGNDYLSKKMYDLYRRHGQAYTDNWKEFYSSMVALWRNLAHKEPFESTDVIEGEDGQRYVEKDAPSFDVIFVYPDTNIIEDISLDQLVIY